MINENEELSKVWRTLRQKRYLITEAAVIEVFKHDNVLNETNFDSFVYVHD